jgi:hypothetical protein
MSSLATPWLDLTVACQRHTLKRITYLTARPLPSTRRPR